jgi:hypothetical protein
MQEEEYDDDNDNNNTPFGPSRGFSQTGKYYQVSHERRKAGRLENERGGFGAFKRATQLTRDKRTDVVIAQFREKSTSAFIKTGHGAF